MEVVKVAYFPIVLYCLLASYSEALPFRSQDSKGKKHCMNLKLNPSKWELRYILKRSQIRDLLRSFEFAPPSFDDFKQNCTHLYFFLFSLWKAFISWDKSKQSSCKTYCSRKQSRSCRMAMADFFTRKRGRYIHIKKNSLLTEQVLDF